MQRSRNLLRPLEGRQQIYISSAVDINVFLIKKGCVFSVVSTAICIVQFLLLKPSCFSLELCANWIITSWVGGVRSCTSITNSRKMVLQCFVAQFRVQKKTKIRWWQTAEFVSKKPKKPLALWLVARQLLVGPSPVRCCCAALPNSSADLLFTADVRFRPYSSPLLTFTFHYEAAIQFGV